MQVDILLATVLPIYLLYGAQQVEHVELVLTHVVVKHVPFKEINHAAYFSLILLYLLKELA